MENSNNKKNEQLGIKYGTACNRLKKNIMFDFAKKLGLNICFQCGKIIDNVEEFSIEHKIPWEKSENPKDLFFDLENIAFSHLRCNVKSSRGSKKYHTEEERILANKESRKKSKNRGGIEARKEKRREDYLKYGH